MCEDSIGSFKTDPLGGRWTQAVKKVATDAWAGKPCNSVALEFDQKSFMSRSGMQRFDTSLYGEDGAQTMARYYVAKMCHVFDMWSDAGCSWEFVFPEDAADSFSEPPVFGALALDLLSAKAQARIEALRGLKPS